MPESFLFFTVDGKRAAVHMAAVASITPANEFARQAEKGGREFAWVVTQHAQHIPADQTADELCARLAELSQEVARESSQ